MRADEKILLIQVLFSVLAAQVVQIMIRRIQGSGSEQT